MLLNISINNFFELEIFSSIRSTFSHDLAPVLFIDFGAAKTKLSIVEYGIIRVFHIVNRGGADISKNISQSLSIPFKDAEKMKKESWLEKTLATCPFLEICVLVLQLKKEVIFFGWKSSR